MAEETPATPAPPTPAPPTPEPSPAQEASPAHDSFGWDDWDGETYDKFPEEVRPWMERANGRYKKDHDARIKDIDERKSIYDSLIGELGDPRVPDLEEQIKKAATWKEGAAQNIGEMVAYIRSLEAKFHEDQRKQAEQEVQSFQRANAWIFDGGEKEHAATELFEAGFAPEVIVEMLRLPGATQTAARDIHKQMKADGVKDPSRYALDLAKAKAQPPPPTEAASLISGAKAPNTGPTKQGQPPTDASLREREEGVLRRKMRI